jgi:hypothetical protein
MSNYAAIHKRIKNLSIAIERRNRRRKPLQLSMIVIYDPDTRQPLPGYEASAANAPIWLPDNKRGGTWLPKKVYLLEPGETLEDGIDP